jgi:PIN domain nuclease of toxin-antitoxin system
VKYLLDTHAFLWWIGDDPALSQKAHSVISDEGNEIYLSAVSVWEIAIKSRAGRLELKGELGSFVERHVRENAFLPLPITLAHSAKVRLLPSHHRDPFDQMLAAQGMVEGMPLITVDKKVGSLGAKVVW